MNVQEWITLTLVVVGAIPATVFPILYSRSPWEKSFTGRALMTSALGLMLLIDLALLARTFGEYGARPYLTLGAFAIIVAGSYAQLGALIVARKHHHPEVENQDNKNAR